MSQFWQLRIHNSNEFYKTWETRFKCTTLEQYYEGFQWKNKRDLITVNYNPYTLNLVYSTIKIKLASLLFQKPSFMLVPGVAETHYDADFAAQSAEIKQDVLNHIVGNKNSNFIPNTKLAALDSFFRFGMIEVGYAADWRNPQKEPLLLSDHGEEIDTTQKGPKVVEDNEVPQNERFYFKRINAKRFRVGVSDASELNDHEWCGYYDFIPTRILRKTKGIKMPSDYQTSIVSADMSDLGIYSAADNHARPDFLKLLNEGEISKVWHIWDMVEKCRYLILDGAAEVLWETDCDRLPFKDQRWDLRLEGFYPIPPVFQWLSSQDEINEGREQMRSFRRRFTRKFQVKKGMVDELEVEKFTSGPDGIVVEVKEMDAIAPIQNPELGQTAQNDLLMAKDDFNIVSGTSADARGGQTDRQTATSSKIQQQRAQIRESAEQMDFSVWLCSIAREALVCAKENLVEGLWVKWTSSIDEAAVLSEVQAKQIIYKYVTSQQIDDGYDFDVEVDVMNQTPAAMEAQAAAFDGFLARVHNFPEIAMSPTLIRQAAMVSGMRNERVIHQMQQVAILAMAAKAAQNAQASGQSLAQAQQNMPGNGNAAKQQISQTAAPETEQIQQQLTQQLQ